MLEPTAMSSHDSRNTRKAASEAGLQLLFSYIGKKDLSFYLLRWQRLNHGALNLLSRARLRARMMCSHPMQRGLGTCC